MGAGCKFRCERSTGNAFCNQLQWKTMAQSIGICKFSWEGTTSHNTGMEAGRPRMLLHSVRNEERVGSWQFAVCTQTCSAHGTLQTMLLHICNLISQSKQKEYHGNLKMCLPLFSCLGHDYDSHFLNLDRIFVWHVYPPPEERNRNTLRYAAKDKGSGYLPESVHK